MKGIILAGGEGSRLRPVTYSVCKQLLPVYDKPLIYYSLSVLMLTGIKDILMISSPKNIGLFENLFGDGKNLGITISYAVQEKPKGIAESFIIGEDFVKKEKVCLILGDNIFYGHNLGKLLKKASVFKKGSVIFGHSVENPSRYGVIAFNKDNTVSRVEEKPKKAKYSLKTKVTC